MDGEASSSLGDTASLLPRGSNADRTLRPEELERTSDALGAHPSLPTLVANESAIESSEYAIEATLGEGGMGEVLLATQRSLRRHVAIKRLKAPDKLAIDALISEARTAGALEHPNVVPVHALGVDQQGRALLVMKRIDGVSLDVLAKNRDHEAWRALEARYRDRLTATIEVLCRVADALEFAHEQRVFHRDVKPENVMVGRHGEVYLLDWGVALDKANLRPDAPHFIVGTPSYIAPEMLSADPTAIDERTDVFLLGATLHAVLTGAPRHTGTTVREALARAAECAPYEYDASIEPELAALCNRATARSPDDRPRDATQFRDELRAFLRQRSALARARRIEARLAELGATADRAPSAAVVNRNELAALVSKARVVIEDAQDEIGAHPALAAVKRAVALAAFEIEIARKDPDAAEAAANEASPAEPTHAPRVLALRAERDESAALELAARAERRERDPRLASAALGALTLGVFLVPMIVSWVGGAPMRSGGQRSIVAEIDLAVLATMVLAIIVGRKRLLANRYGRSATLVVFAIVSAGTIADALAAAQQRTSEQAAPFTLAALVGPLVAGASLFGWPMAACGIAAGLGAALSVAHPASATAIVATIELLVVATTLTLLIRASREPLDASVG
jgi:predicted Ser/Thr protein kinase